MKDALKDMKAIAAAMLRPFVRFCLRRGLRMRDMQDALKRAMLDIAAEELKQTGTAANPSRLSVMTGIQRKEIKRLSEGETISSGSADLLTRVIGQWQSNPQFKTKEGKPKALSIKGKDSEFSELVFSVSNDVSPYTVLFGLEQAGSLERKDNRAILTAPAYISSKNIKESLSLLSDDTADLISAVEDNLFNKPEIPNLHLTTVFDNICLDEADNLREWILDQGTAFHEKIRTHLSKFDKDANPRLYKKKGGVRISVGAFSIVNISKENQNEN
jgi:hypothetical protein